MPMNVPTSANDSGSAPAHQGSPSHPQSSSFTPSSHLASYAIAQDLQEEDGEQGATEEGNGDGSPGGITPSQYALDEQYRRPSVVTYGQRPLMLPAAESDHFRLSRSERQTIMNDERSLLRDCEVIPPKHPRKQTSEDNLTSRLSKQISFSGLRRIKSHPDEETRIEAPTQRNEDADGEGTPTERTALLSNGAGRPYGGQADTEEDVDKRWEEAVLTGKIHTTWQREAKTLAKYSSPLILTFLLQYSLTMASIFVIGHIGKEELAGVSLATMTANITGYAVYHGLSTSLDTLCAQAYGSGRKTLVGVQLQRMIYFLMCITVPIAIIWLSAESILGAMVPDKQTAVLAGRYLRILIIGAPGYACFESGKRFFQAQGLFSATTYVLLICAPFNAFMNWLLVWKLGWGFIGAPIAVVITDNMLPLLLVLYVVFIDGRQCWGGFERRALRNWSPMIKLALPGLVMVMAEFLAFEILTLAASYLSTAHLAAQSVLSTVAALMFQIPFPVSVAASTRIANLIGATLVGPAKVAAKVDMAFAVCIGLMNLTLLSSLRQYIPRLFSNDEDVVRLVADVLPLCAGFQLFDSLATNCNGILRGLGKQSVGSWINLFSYYVIALPIAFTAGFGLNFGLYGLWSGPALGLAIVFGIEVWFLSHTSWEAAVEAAVRRNTAG